jgi:hypothetical protein
VPGDPADVGDAAEHVVVVVVPEHVLVGEGGVQEVPGSAVSDALGSPGAPGGVQDEEVVFGVHCLRGTVWKKIIANIGMSGFPEYTSILLAIITLFLVKGLNHANAATRAL